MFIEAALGPSDGHSAFETEISRDLSRMEGHLVSAATATSREVAMISVESQQLFNAPHVILAPGLAITLTVLGFNLLGDGLRDALDPRLNR